MKPPFALCSFLALVGSSLLAISYSHAGQIWDGSGTDDNWNTAANWDSDALPTFTTAITFTGNVRNGAVNDLTAAFIIGGINLTNDGTTGKTNAFTLSGNSITLGGDIPTTASSSVITDSISLNMILNADRIITTNTNHNLSVSGIISQSGTRRLTKGGAGILTLSNANTYSGGTTINSGTLNVANLSGLGASGTVSLGSGSTLRLATDTAFGSGGSPVYNVEMKNPGPYTSTIELNRATAGPSAGITHNFGSFEISLNGGTNATLNVTAGANAPGTLDTIAFNSMRAGNNNDGVTETLNPTGGNITIGTLKAFGTNLVTMALSGTTAGNAITGVIGGTGNEQKVAISKIGASTWTLSNAGNNYTGGTTFSGGTLVFANGALGTAGAITASGGTLRWATGNTQDISSRLAMTAATSTFDTNGNDVTFASAIGSGVAAALSKTGSGTLTLQGTNTYTGITTVNGGTLSLDYSTGNTNRIATGAALTLGGGTINLSGGGPFTQVVNGTTLTANTGSYVTRTSGSSVLQMGTITPNTGTVDFGADSIATANNTHTAGTILGTWATVGGDWAVTADSGTNIPITAYASYTDVARLGTPGAGIRTIADGSTTNVRLTEGTGDSGTVTLGAVTTQINTLNQSISGGTSGVTIDAAGKTLRTNAILMGPTAGALTIGAAGGTTALSGTLSSTAATGSIIVTNNSTNALTINSVIANNTTTSLVKTGTGVLVLNGLNTYTGGTTLQDGTLRVGATVGSFNTNGILGGVFNTGLTIANKSTAVFDVNGQTAYIKDLKGGGSLGGNVTLGSGTLFLTNPSGTNSYDGIISGTGNVSHNGSSGWNTTGAHTYTGITTIQGGTFSVNMLSDGGIASGVGQSSSAPGNLVFTGGILTYNSTARASTNRQFTLGGNGQLNVNGAGSINWTSTAAITHSNVAAKILTLSGTAGSGGGVLAAQITNSGTGANITSVKLGGNHSPTTGANWSITNTNNTFTGAISFDSTTFTAGTLSYASAGGANPITFNQTTSTAGLSYIGSTDKTMSGLIQANALTTGGAVTLDSSGTGAINYSNTGSLGNGGASGAKGLVLSGTNTGNNILAGQWVNNVAGGAATLAKNGAGTWRISGNNTHSGATTVNGGTLQISHANALGFGGNQTTATGATTVSSGFTLDLNGSNTIHEPITLNGTGIGGNGALINNSGTTAVIGNGIAGIQLPGATTGTGYSVAPTVSITGTGTGATATATLGLTAASLGITAGGTNWAVGNQLAITGGGGSGAVAQVTSVSSGAITGLSIVNPGTGYTSAPTGFTKISGAGTTTNPTLSFNGTNFTVSGVAMTNAGSGYTGTPTYAFSAGNAVASTVALSSVILAADSSIGGSGNTTINAVVSQSGGARALTKVGAGTLTLSGANAYTGATAINGGTLIITGDTQGTSAITFGGGKLGLDIASTITAASASVNFTGQQVMVTGTPTLVSYTLLTASSITGTPTLAAPAPAGYELKVESSNTLKLVKLGYASWATLNGAGPNLGDDHDNDGVDNGTEYFLFGPNGPSTGFTLLPGVTNTLGILSVTWNKGAGYIGVYNTDFVVETSTTLSGPWTVEASPGNVADSPASVTYTFPGGPAYSGKRFARLKVTGP